MRKIENLLLIISISSIFIAGLYYEEKHILITIFLLIIGIKAQLIREKLQSNISGHGVKNITVDKKQPTNPEEGDVWIDTN